MPGGLVLVLDAGTGGGRVMAVDSSGRVCGRAYRAWGYFEPAGLELYGREFDPANFQKIMAGACREAVEAAGADKVRGVVTTGMRQGCVFLDREGKPVYGGPNRDVRGIIYTDEIEQMAGEDRAYSITGRWPPWMFMPSRLHWFRREKPEAAEKVALMLMINDWLLYWLTGRAVSEPTNAAESMLFDVSKRDWSEEMLEALEISRGLLPEAAACGGRAGQVRAEAAAETGIPEGTPVFAGMADTQAALIAGGVVEPGDAGIVAGTTAPVMLVTDEVKLDPERRLWIGCHPLSDRWVVESNSGDAGMVYRGYVENHLGLFAEDKARLYDKAEELARGAGAGGMGAQAFLGPVIWDLARMTPSARAGLFLSYPPGEENAGPGNVVRSILENIAFALKANLAQAAEVAGEPGRVTMGGGMTRCGLFCEVVAAVLEREIEVVPEHEATAVGCAMAGFYGLGDYPDLLDSIEAMKPEPKVIEPDEDDADDYQDLYEEWMEKYPLMMGLDD